MLQFQVFDYRDHRSKSFNYIVLYVLKVDIPTHKLILFIEYSMSSSHLCNNMTLCRDKLVLTQYFGQNYN